MPVFFSIHEWLLVYMFLLGLILGSFVNVIAFRLVHNESLISPQSRCPECGGVLKAWELIPVVSFLILRGRCHHCRAVIPLRYPVVELLTALLFAVTYLEMPNWPERVAFCAFWLLLTSVYATDLLAMTVPNRLSLPGFILCFCLSVLLRVEPWQSAIIGSVTGFLVIYLLHVVSGGRMGIGDAKLYLSIGAMLGAVGAVEALVLASFFGSVVGLAMRFTGLVKSREPIPFVPYIACGVVITAFTGSQLLTWYMHVILSR